MDSVWVRWWEPWDPAALVIYRYVLVVKYRAWPAGGCRWPVPRDRW